MEIPVGALSEVKDALVRPTEVGPLCGSVNGITGEP